MLKAGEAKRLNDLLTLIGLPETFKGVAQKKILDAMHHDKKFVAGKNRFVLARNIGSVQVVSDVALSLIQEAIQKYQS